MVEAVTAWFSSFFSQIADTFARFFGSGALPFISGASGGIILIACILLFFKPIRKIAMFILGVGILVAVFCVVMSFLGVSL